MKAEKYFLFLWVFITLKAIRKKIVTQLEPEKLKS